LFSGLFSLPIPSAEAAAEPARGHSTGAPQTFIAGSENALVRRLASAVSSAELPYNPIVLCGPPATGKSSVARAVAALRRDQFASSEVIVTSGVDLARDLAHAIDTQSVNEFRIRFQRCDILLVNDIHRLAVKHAAQQFLLSALDFLVRRGSLVIVTLRQVPTTTNNLPPQLVSRLMAGLVVELSLPGPLARREIVGEAASRMGLRLADDAVAKLAQCGEDSGEVYLSALALRQRVLELAADAELGSRKQKDPGTASSRRKSICRQAALLTAKHFGFTLGELKGKSRRQALADARGLAMFVCRRVSDASYAEIGEHFGGRDHTTVLHACQKFESIIRQDESIRRLADELATQIVTSGAY
jgi:chromosomal replication initiator protein